METIQGRKLFKGENYSRKYGIQIFNTLVGINFKVRFKLLSYSTIMGLAMLEKEHSPKLSFNSLSSNQFFLFFVQKNGPI